MQEIAVWVTGNRCMIRLEELVFDGFCGRGGTTAHKREGDGKTPLGVFAIRWGFYRGCRPCTALPMVRLSPYHRWIDDPASLSYNRLVFGRGKSRGEAMWGFSEEYALGLVIEYNRRPVIPGAGSAIFFHCGHAPTAGCIAAPKKWLEQVVRRLDPAKTPCINIQKIPLAF